MRLGMIERSEGKTRDQMLDKHSTYLQDERLSTYETIFEPKKPIELEKLFEHESLQGKERKRVYIQGAAGSGKSTLCHYIAYHWAKGSLWTASFKYLFWIPLRNLTEKRYPDDKTYTPFDLIIKEYEGEMDLREFQTYLEQPDVRNQTLILLDGYDELSSDAQRETGNLAKAFNKLKKMFPHLLITSRPGPCLFDRSCDLELLGFDRPGVTDYINKFFTQVQGEEKKKKLQDVLTDSPHALSLAHIPINLTLLCALFNEDPKVFDLSETITMTFIYDRIVNQMYKWFMLRRIDQSASKQTKERILEEQHLRSNQEVKEMAQVLEEMAFFMMEQDTLHLNKNEMEEFAGKFTLNELTNCGLLRLPAEKGYFIHLTFQEFFTASKLANHYLEEKEREKCQDFIQKNKFDPRYHLIFRMIAGYLSIHTATNRRRSHVLQTFFNDLFDEPRDLAKGYELIFFAKCFEECLDPSQIPQYETFIEDVKEYIQINPFLDLDFQIFKDNPHLLHHDTLISLIVDMLDSTTKTLKILDLLEKLGKARMPVPQQIICKLTEKASHSDSKIPMQYKNVLDGIVQKSALTADGVSTPNFKQTKSQDTPQKRAAQERTEPAKLAEKKDPSLQELIQKVGDQQYPMSLRKAHAVSLGKLVKKEDPVPDNLSESLQQIIRHPDCDDAETQSWIAMAIGIVSKSGCKIFPETMDRVKNLVYKKNLNQAIRARAETALAYLYVGKSQRAPEAKRIVEEMLDKLLYEAFSVLIKINKENGFISVEMIQKLQDIARDSCDRSCEAIDVLGAISVNRQSATYKKALETLIEMTLPNRELSYDLAQNYVVDWLAANVLESEDAMAMDALKQLASRPFSGDRNLARVLGKIAEKESKKSIDAVQSLQVMLRHNYYDPKVFNYATDSLERIVKNRKQPQFNHALQAMVALAYDYKADAEEIINSPHERAPFYSNISQHRAEVFALILRESEILPAISSIYHDVFSLLRFCVITQKAFCISGSTIQIADRQKRILIDMKDLHSGEIETHEIESILSLINQQKYPLSSLFSTRIKPFVIIEDYKRETTSNRVMK